MPKNKLNNYPPGSKREALQLGVHLILLYFIRIWILSAGTFFLFGWWMVGGVQLFGSLNLLIIIWYLLQETSGIDVYVYIWESVQNNSVIGLIFFRSCRPYPTAGSYFSRLFPDRGLSGFSGLRSSSLTKSRYSGLGIIGIKVVFVNKIKVFEEYRDYRD